MIYFALVLLLAGASHLSAAPSDGRIHISYWEKWSGLEEIAMHEVVEEFNHSQNRITVDFLSVGEIEQKTLLATAGGDPPDLSGVYLNDVCAFADHDALTPLSPFMREDGFTPEQFNSRYARAFVGIGTYRGETWAVPTTPSTAALFWNKDLFRAAGLDPERPPRTIAEMVAMSQKLTVRDAEGNLKQVGFLPQLQSGWVWAFVPWFGGELFDGKNITVGTNPQALAAYQWATDFTKMYGQENVRRLTSSFGNGLSAQDPFMMGQVAMILDGVWRYDYIQQFAPGLNYGVTRWPEALPGIDDFTVAESDMLLIPRGAKHPHEAWEFLKYVSTPNLAAQTVDELSGVERLCYIQRKPSPLSQWSPFFTAHHPNPNVGIFRQLAESPHAVSIPQLGMWDDYQANLMLAFDKMRLGLATPEQALQHCQERVTASWDWHRESMALREKQASSNVPAPATP